MDMSNRRIVLLGKTEAGKSSLANTIFGEKVFQIDDSAISVTSKCEAETKSVNGRSITLIDTPGFFDTDRSEDDLRPEIVRCLKECAPGPHAFLIVLKVHVFTEQEQDVINRINKYFSEEAFKYAIIVFTHGDQLPEEQTIEDFVHQNKLVSDLVKKCGGRCHVVDNKYWNQKPNHEYRSNQFQVEELLKTIDRMVMENNGSFYTNEMLQAVGGNIKQEEENITCQKSSGNIQRNRSGSMDEPVSNRRIVLLGKTGAGKSSLANTIFGEKVFQIGHTVNSVTSKCEAKTKSVNGRSITLIDCPGFFDTHRSEDELRPEIVRCITECTPGPHAFLILLRVDRFTEQEQDVINKIIQYFSEEAFRYATVVFTHGDQLHEGQTIEDFIHQNKEENELLSDLMKKCGGRCHVIDNKYWNQKPKEDYRSNQFQVEELLKTTEKMVKENKGSCYTNEMLQAVEGNIKQEEEKIRHQKSSGNMSDKEIREKAKAIVFTNLWNKSTGVKRGLLLAALGGLAVISVLFLGIPIVAAVAGAVAGEVAAVEAVAAVAAGAAAGAAMGWRRRGLARYEAAEGADTPWRSVKNAAGTVKNEAEPASTGAKDDLKKRFQPHTQGSEMSNRRIVLLGKTGAGKSSLANTIFGERKFKIGHTVSSGSKCQTETKSVNGRSITLIDCPGFFDTHRPEDDLRPEIVRCVIECAPGPHAFLIVLKVERFTDREQAVINKINEYFSEEAFRYAIIVFTHGDQLPEGQTIEDFIHQNKKVNKLLSDLMKKCGGRYHVVDNKYWNQKLKHEYRSNQFQVEELLKTIDRMVMENNASCYTNEMLQAVEEEIEREEENIRLLPGNMSGSMDRPVDLQSSWSCNVQ